MSQAENRWNFDIVCAEPWDSPFGAQKMMAKVDLSSFFHAERRMRPPLGSYNESVGRLTSRLQKYADALVATFGTPSLDSQGPPNASLVDGAVEALEPLLFAAAEHVDDLEGIASGMFKTHPLAKLDPRFKMFSNNIDKAKRFVSNAANKIKHNQNRPRPICVQFDMDGSPVECFGIYFEGVSKKGGIGPSGMVDSTVNVYSMTAIAWEVVVFLLKASVALETFFKAFHGLPPADHNAGAESFSRAVLQLSRLPLYAFEEKSPFKNAQVNLSLSPISAQGGPWYRGSLLRPWNLRQRPVPIANWMGTVGDGVSNTFEIVSPKNFQAINWSGARR